MSLIWTDTTSYGRGERGVKEPSCFSTDVGPFHLTVLTSHIYHKGEWAGMISPLLRDPMLLRVQTLEEAKAAAVAYLRRELTKALHGLESA